MSSDSTPRDLDPDIGVLTVAAENVEEIVVTTSVQGSQYPLARVRHFRIGETHELQGLEVKCEASGGSLDEAIESFGRAIYVKAHELMNAVDAGTATLEDTRQSKLLSDRLARIHVAQRNAELRPSESRTAGLVKLLREPKLGRKARSSGTVG